MDTFPINLNGHAVGIILKELVRRSISAIRAERFAFVAKSKQGYSGAMDDMVTSADKRAQEVIIRSLRECFPGVGIIAEEEELQEACTLDGHDLYFTVDPLDGTKAFVRRQSHDVGTMIGMVLDGKVISAYVGDVTSEEIYGYRPGSDTVHRISEYDTHEDLVIDEGKPLHEQHILVRGVPEHFSETAQKIIKAGNAFKEYEKTGGSIGTNIARLWKGELGGAMLKARHDTPWDSTPVFGICAQLGFKFYKILPNDPYLEEVPFVPQKEVTSRDYELLIIHARKVQELRDSLH